MPELLYKAINFFLLLLLFYLVLKNPVKRGLKERHERLRRALEEAQEAKRLWEERKREYEERLKGLEDELKRIREQVLLEAQRERERILREAQKEAERILLEAERAIEGERKLLERQIREKLVDSILSLSQKLIRENLRPEDQLRLLDRYVRGLEELR